MQISAPSVGELLSGNHSGADPSPALVYWASGTLSSVLDNAPTYLSCLSALFGTQGQALGHPVVGDFLYGAPHVIKRLDGEGTLELPRNFLHAAYLEFTHPRTEEEVSVEAPLAGELVEFLEALRGSG